MKPEELQTIRERADKATVGPWTWENIEGSVWPWRLNAEEDDNGYVLESCEAADSDDEAYGMNVIDISYEDAEFIAHAREDVPKLLDEIEALQSGARALSLVIEQRDKEVARLRNALENVKYPVNTLTSEDALEYHADVCNTVDEALDETTKG